VLTVYLKGVLGPFGSCIRPVWQASLGMAFFVFEMRGGASLFVLQVYSQIPLCATIVGGRRY
jgi:hypothetical protein